MTTLPTTTERRHRTRIRPIGVLAASLVVIAASYGATQPGRNTPTAPPKPAVAERAAAVAPEILPGDAGGPTGADDLRAIDAQIATWGAKAAADARDDISAGNLAVLYLGRGRLTGDAADYERSLAAADRAVAANPVSTGTRALKATVLQATHDFTGALALAEAVLEEEPANVDALAVAGDAQLELGRLSDAARTYARAGAVQSGAALDARLARLAWLRGDGVAAIGLAHAARDAAVRDGSSDPSFYEAQLGEMARLTGDVAAARASFDAALELRPGNQLALLGRARLEAFAGDDAAAIATLREAAAVAPRPETLALLSDLLARAGERKEARELAETIEVVDQLGGTSAKLFDRQVLAFLVDHDRASAGILVRVRASAETRPDAAGIDLVAWAAFRLGDLDGAAKAAERALATGTIDARILYHAGAIAIARGDVTTGRGLIARALELGPALDPADRSAAEALLAG
jgi:tetratricopeptide (TPR) repeat protein